jgi:hypothetical protein
MKMTARTGVALALTWLGLGGAALGAGKRAAPAAREELLVLGVRTGTGRLATFLVDARGLQLAGEDIAVPTDAGWKRLTAVHVAPPPEKTGSEGEDAESGGGPPSCYPGPPDFGDTADTLRIDGRECTPTQEGAESQKRTRSPSGNCSCQDGEGTTRVQELGFVSPTLVSVRQSLERRGNFCACNLCTFTASANYVTTSMTQALATCTLDGEPRSPSELVPGHVGLSEPGWGIFRRDGQWTAERLLPVKDEEESEYTLEPWKDAEHEPLPLPLPPKLTGQTPLDRPWAAYAREYPGLQDVVVSPSKTFRLLVLPEALVLVANEGREQRHTLKGARVVMTQWALGRHVARWKQEVPRVLKAAPPPGDEPKE